MGEISFAVPHNEALALLAKYLGQQINTHGVNMIEGTCSHCKILGYSLKSCFKANSNSLVCSHYHIPGHAINTL